MALRDMLRGYDGDERVFAAHVIDLAQQAAGGRGNRFVGFCDERQAEIVRAIARAADVKADFFGGYDGAERTVCALYDAPFCEPKWPITPVLITAYGEISHRDILGAVMALGIKRENTGDIIRTDSGHVIFLKPPADTVVINDLDRAGREAVKCSSISFEAVPEPIQEFKEIKGTVKSMRLDSVVSLCTGCSRQDGKALVETGRVTVNAVPCDDSSFALSGKCTLSVRGHGKFVFEHDGTVSAKGRYFLTINKYI